MANINKSELQNQLYELRRQLLDNLKSDAESKEELANDFQEPLKENVSELSDNDNHLGDLGTEQFEREKNIGLFDFQREKLFEVEAALHRMQRGGYGYCQKCGSPINGPRLQAIPYARYCISCAEL